MLWVVSVERGRERRTQRKEKEERVIVDVGRGEVVVIVDQVRVVPFDSWNISGISNEKEKRGKEGKMEGGERGESVAVMG
jgi:hypothetical protein